MKKSISLIVFVLFFLNLNAQNNNEICNTNICEGNDIRLHNLINIYSKYDFSDLIADDGGLLGVIGDDYQRLDIKILCVKKNNINDKEYLISGFSRVKNNICSFSGHIIIDKIQKVDYGDMIGLDNEYADSCKFIGLISGTYQFNEDSKQNNTGVFSGVVNIKWYLDLNNKVRINDIDLYSDGYFNNAYVGNWTSYKNNNRKICNWGNYRVPNTKCDFDDGSAEFMIADKYVKNGWENYRLAFGTYEENSNVLKARKEEMRTWWK